MSIFNHDPSRDDPSFAGASVIDPDFFTQGNRTDVTNPAAPTASVVGYIGDEFDFKDDVDVYRIEVLPEDGGFVTFTFDIDHTTRGLDSQIHLFDGNGNFIEEGDDNFNLDAGSTSTHDSFMTYTPAAAGYYYIVVTSYNNDWRGGVPTGGNSQGDYVLNISVSGSQGIQTYGDGTYGGDALYGDNNSVPVPDTLHGYSGDDYMSGDGGDDHLFGGDGADTISGGEGDDTIFGDDDNHFFYFLYGGIDEGPGDEDLITGGNGNDTVYAGRGNDAIFGGAGDDALDGGEGDDRFDGGAGIDTYARENPATRGIDTFVLRYLETTAAACDVFDFGSTFSSFNGAGAAGGDIIEFAGLSGPVFWQGQSAINIAIGSALPGARNGVIDAFFTGNGASTWLILDADDDGRVGANDLMVRFNKVLGLIASDFKPGQTADAIIGDASDQSFTGTAAPDYFKAGGGVDTVRGGGGVDLLLGESGNDRLFGDSGNDSLDGGDDNDMLCGGIGNDYLTGGLGNDVLTGGAGRDIMNGNGGADRFDFNALAETGVTAATRDDIAGFRHGVDKIDLSTIDAITGGGLANDAFLFGGAFAAGHVRAVQSGLHTIIEINTDADIAPEAAIRLLNFTASTLTGSDFIL